MSRNGSLLHLRPRKAGFTLVEVLISAMLLGIIAVSITQAFVFLNRTSARSRIGTAALIAAQQEIDKVMSVRPYTSNTVVPQILRVQSEGGTMTTGESWASSGTDSNGRAFSIAIRPVGLMVGEAKGSAIVQGMLTRKITIVNASLRQIDVVVGYNFRSGTNAASYTYTNQTAFESAYRYQVRTSTFRSPDE